MKWLKNLFKPEEEPIPPEKELVAMLPMEMEFINYPGKPVYKYMAFLYTIGDERYVDLVGNELHKHVVKNEHQLWVNVIIPWLKFKYDKPLEDYLKKGKVRPRSWEL